MLVVVAMGLGWNTMHLAPATTNDSTQPGLLRKKIMKKILISLITICMFLSGCATTSQQITDADRGKLGSVVVAPGVAKPEKMYYFGPGASIGLLFGAVGGAITAGAQQGPAEQFQAFVDQNKVQIEKIVLEEATSAFRKSGKIGLKDAKEAGASTLNVSIEQYGFSVPNGFSSKLVPIVSITCTVVDGSGKTIWSASDRVLPLGNPVDGYTPEQFKNDAKLIEQSWRLATRAIVEKIVSNL
jgi:hypothetical protein